MRPRKRIAASIVRRNYPPPAATTAARAPWPRRRDLGGGGRSTRQTPGPAHHLPQTFNVYFDPPPAADVFLGAPDHALDERTGLR